MGGINRVDVQSVAQAFEYKSVIARAATDATVKGNKDAFVDVLEIEKLANDPKTSAEAKAALKQLAVFATHAPKPTATIQLKVIVPKFVASVSMKELQAEGFGDAAKHIMQKQDGDTHSLHYSTFATMRKDPAFAKEFPGVYAKMYPLFLTDKMSQTFTGNKTKTGDATIEARITQLTPELVITTKPGTVIIGRVGNTVQVFKADKDGIAIVPHDKNLVLTIDKATIAVNFTIKKG